MKKMTNNLKFLPGFLRIARHGRVVLTLFFLLLGFLFGMESDQGRSWGQEKTQLPNRPESLRIHKNESQAVPQEGAYEVNEAQSPEALGRPAMDAPIRPVAATGKRVRKNLHSQPKAKLLTINVVDEAESFEDESDLGANELTEKVANESPAAQDAQMSMNREAKGDVLRENAAESSEPPQNSAEVENLAGSQNVQVPQKQQSAQNAQDVQNIQETRNTQNNQDTQSDFSQDAQFAQDTQSEQNTQVAQNAQPVRSAESVSLDPAIEPASDVMPNALESVAPNSASAMTRSSEQAAANDVETEGSAPKENSIASDDPQEHVLISHQSPIIDIQATGQQKLKVGQESLYRLKVRNTGMVEAQNLVVTTLIPETVRIVEIRPSRGTFEMVEQNVTTTDMSTFPEENALLNPSLVRQEGGAFPSDLSFAEKTDFGNANLRNDNLGNAGVKPIGVGFEIEDQAEAGMTESSLGRQADSDAKQSAAQKNEKVQSNCLWNIGTLEGNGEECLSIRIVPLERSNIELVSQYEFAQNAIETAIEVEEPVLELEIDGQDCVVWGAEEKYRLRIRNVGNGNAQNVRLSVSTDEYGQATQMLKLLKAGEEKVMDLSVKTVLEDSLSIVIEATGEYGLSARTEKSINVLRGKLDLFIEAPELQFVKNSVDYLIHVSNVGSAEIQNVKIAADIPTNARFLSCSHEGRFSDETGNVGWTLERLEPGMEQVYQVTCEMLQEGMCPMNVAVSEPSGLASTGEAFVQVDAIAALNMKIESPKNPMPIGSNVTYEVVINNNGTCAAEDVNSGLFLAEGLKPLLVEGGKGNVLPEDSRVLFNKINRLEAGQTVSYKVQVEVTAPGNQKVQAILESRPNNIQLVREEMVYCYERRTVANRNNPSTSKVALRPVEPSASNSGTVRSAASKSTEKSASPSEKSPLY